MSAEFHRATFQDAPAPPDPTPRAAESVKEKVVGSAPLIALTVLLLGAAATSGVLRLTLGADHHFPLWPLFAGMGLISAGGIFILPARQTYSPVTPLNHELPVAAHDAALPPRTPALIDVRIGPEPFTSQPSTPVTLAGATDTAGAPLPIDIPGSWRDIGGPGAQSQEPPRAIEDAAPEPVDDVAESNTPTTPDLVASESHPAPSMPAEISGAIPESVQPVVVESPDSAPVLEPTISVSERPVEDLPLNASPTPEEGSVNQATPQENPPPPEVPTDNRDTRPSWQRLIQAVSLKPTGPTSTVAAESTTEPSPFGSTSVSAAPPVESPIRSLAARMSARALRLGRSDLPPDVPGEARPVVSDIPPSSSLSAPDPAESAPDEYKGTAPEPPSPSAESLEPAPGPEVSAQVRPELLTDTQSPPSEIPAPELLSAEPVPNQDLPRSSGTGTSTAAGAVACVRCNRRVGTASGLSGCVDCGPPFCTDCFHDLMGAGGPLRCSQCFMWNPSARGPPSSP